MPERINVCVRGVNNTNSMWERQAQYVEEGERCNQITKCPVCQTEWVQIWAHILPWHSSVRTSLLSQSLEQRQTELETTADILTTPLWNFPYVNGAEGWKKRTRGTTKRTVEIAVRQAKRHTDRCFLPWEQWVFDFLAIAELFWSSTEELATISTGLWHWRDRVIHHTETNTHISVLCCSPH